MKKKIFRWILCGGMSLTPVSLMGTLGLIETNSSIENSKFTVGEKQVLTSQQQSFATKTISNQTMPELDVSDDGTVNGFKEWEKIRDQHPYPKGSISLNIPSESHGIKLRKIAEEAFSACDFLKEVVVPDSIESIGDSAFEDCSDLKKITLHEGLKTIGEEAFRNCTSLVEVTIPSSVKSIGTDTFFECSSLSRLTLNEGLENIGETAFRDCSSLTTLVVPNSVESIGDSAFEECRNLKNLTLNEGLKSIGNNAFYKCNSITNVVIPTSVESIGKGAFICSSLKEINIPKKILTIKSGTFYGECLQTIFIPGNVSLIEPNAIVTNDGSKMAITLLSDHLTLRRDSIKVKKNNKISHAWTVNEQVQNYLFNYPSNSNPLFNNVEQLQSSNDVYYRSDQHMVGLTKQGKTNHEVTIPANITTVSNFAFSECSENLEKITIENDDVQFDEHAFLAVGKNTEYYVKNIKVATRLKNVNIDSAYINISNGQFSVDSNGIIQHVNKDAVINQTLTIPKEINHVVLTGFKPNAFSDCKNDLNKIVFKSESQIHNIDPQIFSDLNNVTYYIKGNNKELFRLLNQHVVDHQRIIIQGNQLDITGNGIIKRIHPKLIDSKFNITIPETYDDIEVIAIDNNAFSGCSNTKTVTFSQNEQAIKLQPLTFNGLSSTTNYYVPSEEFANTLISKTNVSPDHVVFKGNDFDVSKSNLIVKVHQSAIQATSLTIPKDYRGIGSDALSEELGNLTTISFEHGSQTNRIDQNAFRNGTSINTYYYVSQDDQSVADALKDKVADNDHILVKGKIFEFTGSGLVTSIHTNETKLIIPKNFGNINVNKIKPNAFTNCTNLRQIEFGQDLELNEFNPDPDTFKGLNEQTILCVYDDDLASDLAKITQLEINVARNTFFFVNKNHQWNGLTKEGRQQTKLVIPNSINKINAGAFDGCSPLLNNVTIKSTQLNIDPGVFKVNSLKNILGKLHFYVFSRDVKNALMKQHIPENNIHLSPSPSLPPAPKPTSPTQTSGLSVKNLVIIVGSTCLAILLLSLGIGLPIRKLNKANTPNVKLTNKRVDKFSTADKLVSKETVKTPKTISQQVNNLVNKVNLPNPVSCEPGKLTNISTAKPLKSPIKAVVDSKSKTILTKTIALKTTIYPTRVIQPNTPTKSVITRRSVSSKKIS